MSWKSLVCVGLLCGLIVAPVAAQPSLSVDLVRDGGGLPVLDGNGDWQWLVQISPDATLATGGNGSIAAEVGFRLTDAGLVGVAGNGTNFDLTDLNPGTQIFTWETLTDLGSGNLKPVGLQSETGSPDSGLAEIFASLGSLINFPDGTARDFVTITSDGPSTTGSLTTTVDVLGAYSGNGRLAQNDPNSTNDNHDTATGTFTATALAGDANLDGTVNGLDLAALGPNWLQSGKIWSQGDFTGDGTVNGLDLAALGPNWLQSITPPGAGAGGNVPEPASILLVILGACLTGFVRVRRK